MDDSRARAMRLVSTPCEPAAPLPDTREELQYIFERADKLVAVFEVCESRYAAYCALDSEFWREHDEALRAAMPEARQAALKRMELAKNNFDEFIPRELGAEQRAYRWCEIQSLDDALGSFIAGDYGDRIRAAAKAALLVAAEDPARAIFSQTTIFREWRTIADEFRFAVVRKISSLSAREKLPNAASISDPVTLQDLSLINPGLTVKTMQNVMSNLRETPDAFPLPEVGGRGKRCMWSYEKIRPFLQLRWPQFSWPDYPEVAEIRRIKSDRDRVTA